MNSFFFFSSEWIVSRILIVSIVVNKIFSLYNNNNNNNRNYQRLGSAGDSDRRSKRFCSNVVLCVRFTWYMVKTLLLTPAIDKGNNENKTITTTPRTKQTKRHNSKTNVPSFCGRCMFHLFSFTSFFIVGGGGCRGGGIRKPTKTKVVLGFEPCCVK